MRIFKFNRGVDVYRKTSDNLIEGCKECFAPSEFCFIKCGLPYEVPCLISYNPVSKNLYLLTSSQAFKSEYELPKDSVEITEKEYSKDMENVSTSSSIFEIFQPNPKEIWGEVLQIRDIETLERLKKIIKESENIIKIKPKNRINFNEQEKKAQLLLNFLNQKKEN